MPHPKIKPLGEQSLFINLCVVAQSGFGKTVLAGTEESMLIISIDPEGTDSALYQGSKAKQWICRDYADLEECYSWLESGGASEFLWICIDSADEAQKALQKSWLDKNRAKAGKRDPDVLGLDGYQITQAQFIRFTKQFNDLPVHVMWTSKPQELTDGEGEVYYLPNIHGGKGELAGTFMGYMKVQGFGVFHEKVTKVGDKKKVEQVRRYHFQPFGAYKGKDRYDALGPYLDNPTLPQIVEMITTKRPALKKATTARSSAAVKKSTTPAARRRRA